MAQEEVLLLLSRFKDDWFSASEIAERLGINKHTASHNLSRLIDNNEVEKRSGESNVIGVFYRFKG